MTGTPLEVPEPSIVTRMAIEGAHVETAAPARGEIAR
jgi:hypothetical protein